MVPRRDGAIWLASFRPGLMRPSTFLAAKRGSKSKSQQKGQQEPRELFHWQTRATRTENNWRATRANRTELNWNGYGYGYAINTLSLMLFNYVYCVLCFLWVYDCTNSESQLCSRCSTKTQYSRSTAFPGTLNFEKFWYRPSARKYSFSDPRDGYL